MTVTNAAALHEYFDKVAEGYWPSNGWEYGYGLSQATTEDGYAVVLRPDANAGERWANKMCHGCGVLRVEEGGRDIKTLMYHRCILAENITESEQNARVCSAEFAMCGKCQMRAALLMYNSDHLVAGYDWDDMACNLFDALKEDPHWEMTLEERKAAGMTKGGLPYCLQ